MSKEEKGKKTQKNKEKRTGKITNAVYVEPSNYIPKDIREKLFGKNDKESEEE